MAKSKIEDRQVKVTVAPEKPLRNIHQPELEEKALIRKLDFSIFVIHNFDYQIDFALWLNIYIYVFHPLSKKTEEK